MTISNVKGKDILLQSNRVIDNRGNWGITGNRIYYSILKRIDPSISTIPIMKIPLSEIIAEWDLNYGKAYKSMCDISRQLIKQAYTIVNYDNQGNETFQLSKSFFKQIKVPKGQNYILVELHDSIIEDFVQLKDNFTKTEFGMIALLTRGTSQNLYDLLMEYKGLGKRVFHARELEKKIKPNASEMKPYDRANKIEEKLVSPAVDEINSKTNLNITYQKFGRGEDTHYEFSISEKEKENTTKSKSADNNAKEVIEHLNSITGHRFKTDGKHPELSARLKEYSAEDCKKVIDHKYKDWEGWDGRSKAMNPTTLFRKKNFEKYMEEIEARTEPPEEHKPTGLPTDIPGVMDDGYINLELAREAYAQGKRQYKDPSGMIVEF